MKKIITLVAVLTIIAMLAIFLPGCEKIEEDPSENIVFELEEVWFGQTGYTDVSHYRDITTDIMYLHDSTFRGGGYTVMPDPETGLSLTYDRYLEIYTVKED